LVKELDELKDKKGFWTRVFVIGVISVVVVASWVLFVLKFGG
jgi:hypothetical protein